MICLLRMDEEGDDWTVCMYWDMPKGLYIQEDTPNPRLGAMTIIPLTLLILFFFVWEIFSLVYKYWKCIMKTGSL